MKYEKVSSLEEAIPILKNVTIFSGMDDEAIRYIFDHCEIVDADVGDVLMAEGSAATEIYVVLKGKVAIVLSLDEDPFEIVEFGPGYCIGEASVIGVQNHSTSAVVMEKATLLMLSRTVLMDIYEKNKTLFSLVILNIARELARRLHHTNEILLHYGRKSQADLQEKGESNEAAMET